MRILVTGATGFLGSHIYRSLSKEHDVTGFARCEKKWKAKALVGSPVLGSMNDFSALLSKDPFDIIIHTAGLLVSHRPREFYQVNENDFQNFLKAMNNHSSSAYIINIGSLAALGPGEGYRKDEPISHYGKSKKAAEDALKKSWPAGRWISLRPPIIMGPEDEGMLEVFQQVQKGIMTYAGFSGKKTKYHFIHSSEIVTLVSKLIKNQLEGIYYTNYPRIITHQEMLEEIHHFTGGKKIKNLIIPHFLIKSAGLLSSLFKLNTQLTRDKAYEICAKKWLCPEPNLASYLDYKYQMNLSQTVADTAKAYQASEKLTEA